MKMPSRGLGTAAQLDVGECAVVGEGSIGYAVCEHIVQERAIEEHRTGHGTHHPGRRKLAYRGGR